MMDDRVFNGANTFTGKISENAYAVHWRGVSVEARNTYTWGAKASEVNEMKS